MVGISLLQKGLTVETKLNENTIVTRAANTAFREMEGRMFLVGADSTRLVMLNATGTTIWNCLEQPSSMKSLAQALAKEFDVTPETALHDCVDFTKMLLERNLVQVSDVQVSED